MTDSYQKEIEDKKLLEENLLGEVGKPKYVWELVILKPYICMLTFKRKVIILTFSIIIL